MGAVAGGNAARLSGVSALDDRRPQVLLVEDDHEVSALTRELLASLGFSVSHVASPEAALRMLAQPHDFDIVLSDLVTPGGVTGLQLARQIRSLQPALRILLTTGSVESFSGMKDEEFPLLLKPYTIQSLTRALEIALGAGVAPT